MLTAFLRAPSALACALLLPALALAESPAPAAAAAPPPIEHFVERDAFFDIKISPDGKHLAASVPQEEGSALLVLETDSLKKAGHFFAGRRSEIADFWWSSDERLLMSMAERFLGSEAPGLTGEIYAANFDGTRPIALAGVRAGDGRQGSRIKVRESELVAVFPIDLLPGDSRQALVQVLPPSGRSEAYASIERMDTENGRRSRLGTSPAQRAEFTTDAEGQLRFVAGLKVTNDAVLHYRENDSADWQLLNDETMSGQRVSVLGFATDGKSAYLRVSRPEGPDAIERFEVDSGTRSEVFRHARRDPASAIRTLDGRSVIGVKYFDPMPQMHFFEPDHPEALLRLSLAAAFKGYSVDITSATQDGRRAILFVQSDRNPGEYFLFDRETKNARHIGSRGRQIVPEQLGETRAIQITARDGLVLDGLLTLPPGADERALPLVVHPHGGPFGIEDRWGFDRQVQLLATRGYAVLQLNFRGSGGFGQAFVRAGYRQWGGAMQDDLTDATRWAIEQGIADARRICIYGASYGGYASLMAVAKEPDLYACAAGDVGVYDLALMHRRGDVPYSFSGRNFLKDALGEKDLAEHSPNLLADRIRVPVMLSAGENDRRAPIIHTERMESALKKAGVPVEALYFRGEGHGYYATDNQLKFQQQLLAFLDRHIGSGWQAPGQAPAAP